MGFYPPGSPPSPHLYPQELQLKLYQAFIFSIPILFTIILVLLFYLFYLKRRASTLSSSLPTSASSNQAAAAAAGSHLSAVCQVGLKEKLSEKLQVVLFDEELRSKESQCCVCLGDFEMKEELLQISSCRHVFHMDCIRHWLLNNSTCPLCRCFVIPTTAIKLTNVPHQSSGDMPPAAMVQQHNTARYEHQVNISTHAERRQLQEEEHAVASPVGT